MNKTVLTEQDVENFHRDGFTIARKLFSPDEIAALREATDRQVEASRLLTRSNSVIELEPDHSAETPRLRRIVEPVTTDAAYWQAAIQERLLDCVSALLGPDLTFHHSKLNMKASKGGAAIGWHQDFPFFPHTNMDLVACGIPLDKAYSENGCLLVVPGTHKGPVWNHRDVNGAFVGQITDQPLPFNPADAVPVEMDPGDVSFHHSNVIHGSTPNNSGNQRRLLIFQYAAADAVELEHRKDATEYFGRVVRGNASPHARLMGAGNVMLRGASNGKSIFGSQQKS